jgi:nucleotidyltransferase/DNA polymerase involved in DNA repair
MLTISNGPCVNLPLQCFIDVTREVDHRLSVMAGENGGTCALLPPLPMDTIVVGRGSFDSGMALLDAAAPDERSLHVAAIIAKEIRDKIFRHCSYTCSAGIGSSKMLAKFASAENKPSRQTVIPPASVELLLDTVPLRRFRGCGGKICTAIEATHGLVNAGEIRQRLSIKQLEAAVGVRSAGFVWNVVRGKDDSSVIVREQIKTLLAAKNFDSSNSLDQAAAWLRILARELVERMHFELTEHRRTARTLSLSFRVYDCRKNEIVTVSRTHVMPGESIKRREAVIVDISRAILRRAIDGVSYRLPISYVGLTAGGFSDRVCDASSIARFMTPSTFVPEGFVSRKHGNVVSATSSDKRSICSTHRLICGVSASRSDARTATNDITSYLGRADGNVTQLTEIACNTDVDTGTREQVAADREMARQISRDEFRRAKSSEPSKRKVRTPSQYFSSSDRGVQDKASYIA